VAEGEGVAVGGRGVAVSIGGIEVAAGVGWITAGELQLERKNENASIRYMIRLIKDISY
jgi:hypothetical protein